MILNPQPIIYIIIFTLITTFYITVVTLEILNYRILKKMFTASDCLFPTLFCKKDIRGISQIGLCYTRYASQR